MIKEMKWNVDGHRLLLTVNKSSIDIAPSICPHGGVTGSPCYHEGINGCAVNYFINVYGLETNHGTAAASETLEVAWSMDGSQWDIDLVEFSMIPVNDPNFADWLSSVAE